MNAVDVIVAFGFAVWKQLKKPLGAVGLLKKNRPKQRQPTYEDVCVRVAELVEKRGEAFHPLGDAFLIARDLRKLNAPLESIARVLHSNDDLGLSIEWVFRVLHSYTGCDVTSDEAIIAIGKGIGPVAEMVAQAVWYSGCASPSEIDIAKAMAYQGRSASEIDIALRSPDGLGLSNEQAAMVANGFLFPYKTNT